MEEKIIKTLTLENGLTLEIVDKSRPIAGDRWLVQLNARIAVPLTDELVGSIPRGELLHREYGLILDYEAELKRHFIGDNERDRVFQGFLDTVMKEKLPYLSHPDFAKKLAVLRLAELKKANPRLFN